MEIAPIEERFAVSNYDGSSENIDEGKFPFVKVEFLVRTPFFSEDTSGELQFARKQRRQFRELKKSFLKDNRDFFEKDFYILGNFECMEKTREVIEELRKKIEDEFAIEDKIEIFAITLEGSWPAYYKSEKSQMSLEHDKKVVALLRSRMEDIGLSESQMETIEKSFDKQNKK